MSLNRFRTKLFIKNFAKESYSNLPHHSERFSLVDYQRFIYLSFLVARDRKQYKKIVIELASELDKLFFLSGESSNKLEVAQDILALVHRAVLTLNKTEGQEGSYKSFVKAIKKEKRSSKRTAAFYMKVLLEIVYPEDYLSIIHRESIESQE